eukprot:m.264422 g.264422  ORF g.264422 m.264422 type:complete len:491 (-) comp56141_c0_seq1:32-1504(-)
MEAPKIPSEAQQQRQLCDTPPPTLPHTISTNTCIVRAQKLYSAMQQDDLRTVREIFDNAHSNVLANVQRTILCFDDASLINDGLAIAVPNENVSHALQIPKKRRRSLSLGAITPCPAKAECCCTDLVNTAITASGWTPLMAASAFSSLEMVRLLLERHAAPGWAKPKSGKTALMLAAYRGHVDIVSELLRHNADPNQTRTDGGKSSLMMAAFKGHLTTVQTLLNNNADPNRAKSSNGKTPLMLAAHKGHLEIVCELLRRGADPNQTRTDDGSTALMRASTAGYYDITRALLFAGADPNLARSDDGGTALILAACNGHLHVVHLLMVFASKPVVPRIAPQGRKEWNAAELAGFRGHNQLATWLQTVSEWTPIRIAISLRLVPVAKQALHLGVIDVCKADTPTLLLPLARTMTDQDISQHALTLDFAKATLSGWSPGRHHLYHKRVRDVIHTVMLVHQRLDAQYTTNTTLTSLPLENWLIILFHLHRSDWNV